MIPLARTVVRAGLFAALAAALPARADLGFTAACDQLTATGLSGVAPSLLPLPDGGYRMYYMGQGMVSAFSGDGVSWTPDPGVRLNPAPGGSVTFASNPWVFVTRGGQYRMVYEGRDAAGNRRLYSALSDDSLNFTPEGLVMAGTEVDVSRSGTLFLSVPTGMRLADGSLRMYYVSDGADTRSAVSRDDGLTWSEEPGTRILQGVDPALFATAGGYTMVYTDWAHATRTQRLLTADSSDGLAFSPNLTPLVQITNGGYIVVDPEVVDVAGAQRLYFSVVTDQTAPPSANASPIYTCVLPQAPASTADADRVFNYAQSAYAGYLAPPAPSAGAAVGGLTYYYRHFSGTGAYIGTANGNFYYLGPASGGRLYLLGSMQNWLGTAAAAGF